MKTRTIVLCAALAALSAAVQLIHIGYRSATWGMWIDIVAVSWFVAYFLFGLRASVVVCLLGALVITLFSPDTWLGASMKFTATVPMIVVFYLWLRVGKKKISYYQNAQNLILPVILGLLLRCIIVIPLNYYYAIPIWTGMSTSEAIAAIPWFIIAGFNIVQGVLDVMLAWIIVFIFRIRRYADWNSKS